MIKQKTNLFLLIKNKINLIFLFILLLINNCSFDNKTGIWSGSEKEKRRISDLEKQQKEIIDVEEIYSSETIFSLEKKLTKNLTLSKSKKNMSWKTSNLNNQNFLGNIYLNYTGNIFLKKKIGKDKFSISKLITTLIAYNENLIFSDDTGTIFNINQKGKIIWKKNIYKKIYKKMYKNLSIALDKNRIYVADNVGFIYSIDLNTGQIIWIKNNAVPLKSNIKISKNKIYLIDQNNKIFSLNTKDGSKNWNVLGISSFIKSQNLLSLALNKENDLIAINSSADLFKINVDTGSIYWSTNTLTSLYSDATDFFVSSDIVVDENQIIFSSGDFVYSYNMLNGTINWEKEASSVSTPIVDKKNIFIVTKNGYFVILNKEDGKIISSNNILKILKKKHRETKVSGFIMGSEKIYSITYNGYLIVSSASSGKTESFKKIGGPISSTPIISNGKLFVLTENSRIVGLN